MAMLKYLGDSYIVVTWFDAQLVLNYAYTRKREYYIEDSDCYDIVYSGIWNPDPNHSYGKPVFTSVESILDVFSSRVISARDGIR